MVIQKEVKSLFELAKAATYRHVVSQVQFQLKYSATENDVESNNSSPEKKTKSILLSNLRRKIHIMS